jgi:hypothetical protein
MLADAAADARVQDVRAKLLVLADGVALVRAFIDAGAAEEPWKA